MLFDIGQPLPGEFSPTSKIETGAEPGLVRKCWDVLKTRGADQSTFRLPRDVLELVLLFGNGLEGDLRIWGNTSDAIELARQMIVKTGNCIPCQFPISTNLGESTDECFEQSSGFYVFLNPQPTGEVVLIEFQPLKAEQLPALSNQPVTEFSLEERDGKRCFGHLEIPTLRSLSTASRQPAYRRGCLTYPLQRDFRFRCLEFRRADLPCVALILGSVSEDHFVCWSFEDTSQQLRELCCVLNDELLEFWGRPLEV